MASKNHLLLVFEKFNKDQHGLLEEDINVKDKQNFPTVQQIVFPKVRKCLEAIDESIVYEGMQFQDHVKGTILHLQVIQAFLEDFLWPKNSIKMSGMIIFCGGYDLFWN